MPSALLNLFVAIGGLKISFIGFSMLASKKIIYLDVLVIVRPNLAVVRHLALNLLTHESTAKGGIHAKRLKAGWNNNYLSLVLNSLSP